MAAESESIALLSEPRVSDFLAGARLGHLATVDASGNACVLTPSPGLGPGDYPPGLDLLLTSMPGEADLLTRAHSPGERMDRLMASRRLLAADGLGPPSAAVASRRHHELPRAEPRPELCSSSPDDNRSAATAWSRADRRRAPPRRRFRPSSSFPAAGECLPKLPSLASPSFATRLNPSRPNRRQGRRPGSTPSADVRRKKTFPLLQIDPHLFL